MEPIEQSGYGQTGDPLIRRHLRSQATAEDVRLQQRSALNTATAQHQRKLDNELRRIEKRVITAQTLVHTRNGPVVDRVYLAGGESGQYGFTVQGHEAATWLDDGDEPEVVAAQVRRDLSDMRWQVKTTRELGREQMEQYLRLDPSKATDAPRTARDLHCVDPVGVDLHLSIGLER